MMEEDFEVVRGSDNIFADLGFADAATRQMKAQLAAEIIIALDRRKLTVREAGQLTGVAAADISRIRNADLGRFTIDRLVKVLAHLDRKVELRVVKVRRNGTEDGPKRMSA